MIRLSKRGRDVLDRALGLGLPAHADSIGARDTSGSVARSLLERLEQAEILHPQFAEGTYQDRGNLTFVVPVLNGADTLIPLLASILPYGEVIVVDDGSTDGSVALTKESGARVLCSDRPRGGPAAARNRGLREVSSELVCFVDSDCRLPRRGEDWLGPLCAALDADRSLAAVAPRVRSLPGPGPIARYECRCSPLDLGPASGLIGAGRRLAYAPSALLLGRTDALEQVKGFDPSLRFGEDVDLCRRLENRGWRLRYVAEAEIEHIPRTSLNNLVKQRFGYGSSAAPLELRHPGAAAPLHVSPALATSFAIAATSGPVAGTSLQAANLARLARRFESGWARRAVIRSGLRGQAVTLRHLARATTREWLPIVAVGCIRSRRLRIAAGAAIAIDLLGSSRLDDRSAWFPSFVALRLIDHVAYAAGVWAGAVRSRTVAPLLPKPNPDRRRLNPT